MIDAKLRVEIEKRLDYLIADAQELVNETEVYKKDKKNQMRNLLEMALSVDSVKALEVFIQYQIGRKELPASFGDRLKWTEKPDSSKVVLKLGISFLGVRI